MTQQKTRIIPLQKEEALHFMPDSETTYTIRDSKGMALTRNQRLFAFDLAYHYPGLDWHNYYFGALSHESSKAFDGLIHQLQTRQMGGKSLILTRHHPLVNRCFGDLDQVEPYLQNFDVGFVTYWDNVDDLKYVCLSATETLGEALPISFLEAAFKLASEELAKEDAPPLTYSLAGLDPNWNLAALLFVLTHEEWEIIQKFSTTLTYRHGAKDPILLSAQPIIEGVRILPKWGKTFLHYLLLGYPVPMALGNAFSDTTF